MDKAELTPRERKTLLVVGLLYAAVVIPIGIHKGGDFTQELGQSERLLHGLPLYVANPEKGIWWPPFTALALVPFALVARWSLAVAKTCWSLLNVGCLGWSVARSRGWASGWAPVLLAVAAVGKPLQSNFEHLNVTPVLLALVVATAADLEANREVRAGLWIGLATAIKGFPALLLLYLAYRRRWRGLATGAAVAGGLTVGAMLPFGAVGAVTAVRDWLGLSLQGKLLLSLGTQSLSGLVHLFGWSPIAVAALELACLAGVAAAFRGEGRRPAASGGALTEVGIVAILAVLFSPVAWLYYYTLAFPAWIATLARSQAPPNWGGWGGWGGHARRAALGLAGLLTSGVLTFGLYPRQLWFVRDANYTWGGLVLLTVLVVERSFHHHPDSQPA